MKQTAVCLAFLIASLGLTAQNPVRTESPGIVLRTTPLGNGCPISMRASHGVWDHTIRVRQRQTTGSFGQHILLSLVDSHPAPIIAATVKVTGTTGKNRMLQTGRANSEPDGIKTIRVTLSKEKDGAVSGDLYVAGLTSVKLLELLDVSYGDGRIWKIGGSGVCRVAPDPLMLVAAD
jgi:hypothetical protein